VGHSPEIYVTRYLYDTWGRLRQLVYPDAEVLTYAYDSGGQVRAVEGVKLGARFPSYLGGYFAASFRTVVTLRSVAGAPSAFSSRAPENSDWLIVLRQRQ
jgi:hypothetical protein